MSGSTEYCSDYPGYPRHCCISCHEDADDWGYDLMWDIDGTYEVCCGVYNEFILPQEGVDANKP